VKKNEKMKKTLKFPISKKSLKMLIGIELGIPLNIFQVNPF